MFVFKRTCGESIYPVLECLKSETMKDNWWITYTERRQGRTRFGEWGHECETMWW